MKKVHSDTAIIKRLRILIELSRDDRLPPLATLSDLLDIPQRALLRAARKLRERGEIDFGTGKGIHIIRENGTDTDGSLSLSSSNRLYKLIRKGIYDGKYIVGERLPKRDHFVLEFEVSSHTVTKALKQLSEDSLIYRKGKSWIVGRPIKPRRQSSRDLPVIITIQNTSNTWQSFRNVRTGKFVDRFAAEAARFGFRLQPFFISNRNPSNLQPYGMMSDLDEFIDRLDHLYFGSIVIGAPENYPSFRGLAHSLALRKRPFVWFDKVHRTPIPPDISPYYYHFHFSETRIAGSAVKYLADHGHKRLLYVDIVETDWSRKRGDLLLKSAREYDLEFVNFMDVCTYYKSMSFDDLLAKLRSEYWALTPRFRKAAAFVAYEYGGHSTAPDYELSPAAQADVARFLQDKPQMDESEYGKLRGAREMLISFLDDRNTAIVFPRDVAARGYLRTLYHMGVTVPQEISTLSFDNHYDSTVFPCNTVDFGAEEMGYQAFHALSGITPVTRNCRDGSIAVVPRVVDRGSVSYLDS